MNKIIIDATDLKVGRIATFAAKQALLGQEVDIINVEKAVQTGSKAAIMKKYGDMYTKGMYTKGPFQPRMADRFVRRIIRGMLPYRTPRGKDAFARIMTYIGNPGAVQATEKLESAHISTSIDAKYMTIKQICNQLGGRHE